MNECFDFTSELNRIYVVGCPVVPNSAYGALYAIFGITTSKSQARQLRQLTERLHPELKGQIITRIYFEGKYTDCLPEDE